MTFKWDGGRIASEIARLEGAGLRAATVFVANRVKEALSVPAPRVRLVSKTGEAHYIAGWVKGGPGLRKANATTFRKDKKTGALRPRNVSYEPAPATKGEPPRKLSGRLRASIAYEFLNPILLPGGGIEPQTGRVGTNVKYARPLEEHKNLHAFLSRTVNDLKDDIARVLWGAAR